MNDHDMDAAVESSLIIARTDRAPACARLEARDVALAFGGHHVLDGVDLDVQPGEIVLLRGDNGSGKTTLLNVLSGFTAPDRGSIRLGLGSTVVDVRRETPERIARLGLGRLWQDIRLFPTLTALDNVMTATPALTGQNPLLALAAYSRVANQERNAREAALANLELVGMRERAASSADMLSVGQMKRVALARLLQMKARAWLLDEPLAGLDAHSSAALARDLDRLRRERDVAILVVEHRHDRLRSIADRVCILDQGRIEPERSVSCPS